MNHWINILNDLADAWLNAIGHACWQGGLALALAWTICRIFTRMPGHLKCWLWRLAYAKLLLSLLWTVPIQLPLLPPPAASAALALPEAPVAPIALANPVPTTLAPRIAPPARPNRSAALLALWFLGASACIVRLLRAWRATIALRRSCTALVDVRMAASCAELSARLGLRRTPALLVADGICCPLVTGLLHPAVLFPTAIPAHCTPGQLRLMLAHELAHLHRRDLLWNWLDACGQVLFFFHPLVWLAGRESRLAQEISCDEAAVSITEAAPAEYGHALLRVVVNHGSLRPRGLFAIGVAGSFNTLERRLVAMRYFNFWSARRSLAIGSIVVLTGIGGLVPWRVVAQERPAPTTRRTGDVRPNPASDPFARTRQTASLAVAGNITAPQFAVASRMEGAISQVAVNEGDRVKKGQLLVQLDVAQQKLRLEQLEAQLKGSQAEDARVLAMRKAGVATQEEVEGSRANVIATRAAVALKQQELTEASIVAPCDGVIAALHVRQGEYVSKVARVASVIEVGQPGVEMPIPENQLPQVHLGQKVELTVSPYPDRRFSGQVTFIAPQIDTATGTVLVKARITDTGDQLLSGMFARITLQLDPPADAAATKPAAEVKRP